MTNNYLATLYDFVYRHYTEQILRGFMQINYLTVTVGISLHRVV